MSGNVLTLFTCADVIGKKVNYELAFNGRPSLTELHTRIVEAFVVALDVEAPGSDIPFQVEMVSCFNLDDEEWHEVTDNRQLKQNCQLYVFQNGHGDPPKSFPAPELPPHALPPGSELLYRHTGEHLPTFEHHGSGLQNSKAVAPPPTHFLKRQGSNRRTSVDDASFGPMVDSANNRSGGSGGGGGRGRPANLVSSGTPSERLFHRLDTGGQGFVTLSALRDTMLSYRMDVSEETVGDTFSHGDHEIALGEFHGFGDEHPNVVSELLRLMDQASPERKPGSRLPAPQQPKVFTPNIVTEGNNRSVSFAAAPNARGGGWNTPSSLNQSSIGGGPGSMQGGGPQPRSNSRPTDLSQPATINSSSYVRGYSPTENQATPRGYGPGAGGGPGQTITMSPQHPHLANRSTGGGGGLVYNSATPGRAPVPSHYHTIGSRSGGSGGGGIDESSVRMQRLHSASYHQDREAIELRERQPGGRRYSPSRSRY